jgi:hypothetical protein
MSYKDPQCAAAKASHARRAARYYATSKGKASKARCDARYNATPKGKASQARCDARYNATPKGKASNARRAARYDATPKGKASQARCDGRRRFKKSLNIRRKFLGSRLYGIDLFNRSIGYNLISPTGAITV